MAVNEATNAPLAVPRSAAERRSKRRMFEHMDVRVRRDRRSASIAGESDEQEVRSTTAFGAMVFGHFLPKQKVARSPLRRAKPSRKRCALGIDKNGFRVLACGQPRNDDVCWIPAFAGMTNARASAYPHPALARHPLPRGEGKLDLGLRRDDKLGVRARSGSRTPRPATSVPRPRSSPGCGCARRNLRR